MKTVRGILTEYELTGSYAMPDQVQHLQKTAFLSGICGGIILLTEAIIAARGNQDELIRLIRSIDAQTQELVREMLPGAKI